MICRARTSANHAQKTAQAAGAIRSYQRATAAVEAAELMAIAAEASLCDVEALGDDHAIEAAETALYEANARSAIALDRLEAAAARLVEAIKRVVHVDTTSGTATVRAGNTLAVVTFQSPRAPAVQLVDLAAVSLAS